MKFDELDAKMRVFETAHDYCVLPGMYMIARLDGRSFTRLTKEVHKFNAPFDERFRDLMVETAEHLMMCGFRTVYAYTESDEISLLFDRDENSFGRKVRKFNSVLAGEASAKFSLLLREMACFDCRISELPNAGTVLDYFRWRNELLFSRGINFNDLPSWQKRGVGIVWAEQEKAAINEKTGEQVTAIRRRLSRIYDLPMRDGYSQFIDRLIQ